jgi:hypothetical protein
MVSSPNAAAAMLSLFVAASADIIYLEDSAHSKTVAAMPNAIGNFNS